MLICTRSTAGMTRRPLKRRWKRSTTWCGLAKRLSELAEKRGLPMAQIALAWMLHKPGITAPIIGASKPGHLEDALAALAVKLSPDEMTFLEECYQPHPVLGF